MAVHEPVVSVVIPCYGGLDFVGESLESVFSQRYLGHEVLLVNDGSPDTPALESLLSPYLPRIRYLRQENRGPSAARNTGIRHARGRYIAFLDSDDVWHPDFLGTMVAVMERDPGLDLAYSDAVLFGDTPRAGRRLGELLRSQGEMTFENLVRRHCIVHPSSVIARRDSLIGAGLFDERIRYSEDLDLWLRVVSRGGRASYVSQALVRRRVHPTSLSGHLERMIESQVAIDLKLLRTLPALTPARVKLLREDVRRCRARLRLIEGIQHLVEARYEEALAALRDGYRSFADWKVLGARIGVRAAPRLTRRLCLYYLSRHGKYRVAATLGGTILPPQV